MDIESGAADEASSPQEESKRGETSEPGVLTHSFQPSPPKQGASIDEENGEIHMRRKLAAFGLAMALVLGGAAPALADAGVRPPGQGSGTPTCVDAGDAHAHHGFDMAQIHSPAVSRAHC